MNLLRTVTLDRASRKKDKSVSLTFITNVEQSSTEFMEIDEQLNQSGVLYFKPNGTLTQKEVDELDNVDIELEGKSKSQRLRNVMYVLWQQEVACNYLRVDFKDFYSDRMELLIEQIKQKLD